MNKAKMQHCFNCGDELGVYAAYYGDGPECCGKQECTRELRYAQQSDRDNRANEAAQDDYSRYGGGY
jgi:hypothetical protein